MLFLAIVLPCIAGADEPKMRFDLPPDAAEKSLTLFSRQSGIEILFPTDAVDGVFTNGVRGKMTAREALDALLAGTSLVAVPGKSAASLTVRRVSGSGAPGRKAYPEADRRSGGPSRQSRSKAKAETAGSLPGGDRLIDKVLAAFVAAIAPAPAGATGSEGVDDRLQGGRLELSPFIVRSDRDTGYQAQNTLAGTRLNTRLEDVGAAISVYNTEFFSDIAATNHNGFLIYAAGMETSGAQGNLSGLTASIGNAATTTTREDPEGGAGFGVAIRTRGLSVPTITRGFFITNIPSDSYNVERVTVNRGPNAILFGVGNPAGIIDSTLLSARLSGNRSKIQLRYGDNDSFRTSVDFNRVLIARKLALRIAALYSREEYDQRPAFEEKRRLYGTVTYEPFRSTAIRVNVESGSGDANRVYTVPPLINYAAWEMAGRQPFDWTFYDDPARNPDAASENIPDFVPLTQNPTAFGDRVIAIFSDPSATEATGFSNQIRMHAPTGGNFHPVFNRDSAMDNFQFIDTRNISDLPAAWWPNGQIPAGIRGQTFTDYSAFDWRKRMLYGSGRQPSDFHTTNIAIEQRAWQDRIGVELAYDRQRYHARQLEGGQSAPSVSIDTNVTVPTGEPNPNLGRPFVVSGGFASRHASYRREGMRVTGYLNYDFSDLNASWGKWLGRHVVTTLLEQTSLDRLRVATQYNLDGPAALQASPDVLNGNRQYRGITYIGPSIIGNNNPVRLEPIRTSLPQDGDTFTATYYDPVAGELVTAETTLVEWVRAGSGFRDVVKSSGAGVQSYWLREHFITLLGWRRDRNYFEQESTGVKRNGTRTGLNDPGTVFFGHDDFDFADTPPFLDGNNIFSYSGVLKWPNALFRLPGNANLSVFYNESENFTPTGGRNDTFQNPLASPSGTTREFGFNLSAFGGRLNIRMNRFETAIVNQTIVSGGLPTQIAETGVVDTVDAWTREGNRNPDNVAFMDAAIARLLSPLPADFMQDRNFTVSGTVPDITTTFGRPQSSDTTDFTAKGTEAEITYNPSRNWRIMANITKVETIQTNIYPITAAMLELMTPVFNSTVTDPVSGVKVNFRDIPKGGYPEGFGPANPPGANIQRFGEWLDSNVRFPLAEFQATDGQASPEQRKWRVNIVANYTFDSNSIFGPVLEGWGVGAGYRWQSRIALGYPSSIDENNIAHFDIANPYWGPAETNVDAWVSYRRTIWNGRVSWEIQLNVKNLIGGDGLIAVRSQPWGAHAAVRIPPEKRWYITNTFEF